MDKPQTPMSSIILRILGVIGILVSIIFLVEAADQTHPASDIEAALAFALFFSVMLLFAASAAISRLSAIEFYLRGLQKQDVDAEATDPK
jgi:hypothetical protein